MDERGLDDSQERWDRGLEIGFGSPVGPLAHEEQLERLSRLGDPQLRLAGAPLGSERYEVRGVLGRGGMGVVLEGHDRELGRAIAFKILRDEFRDNSLVLRRFLSEARIAAQLDHPGILPVHDLGVDADGRVYYTMDLVRGHALDRVLAMAQRGEGGWSLPRILSTVQRICEAMAYAHSKRVIHRDLKPSNVMVGNHGEAFVVDWGVARILHEQDEHDLRIEVRRALDAGDGPRLTTCEGAVVGTPCYMSPEQALGDHSHVGPSTDVYAVGSILYHVLAGTAPYAESGSSPVEVWERVRMESPRPLGKTASQVPPELVAITEHAMARSIESRYPGMQDLAADLRSYLEGRVVRAHATGAWAEARKWMRRNRALAAALAVLFCVLSLGGVGFGLVQVELTDRANDARLDAENTGRQLREARDRSEAMRLATAARIDLASDPERALLLAREAALLRSDPDTRTLLLEALWTARDVLSPAPDGLRTLEGHLGAIRDLCPSEDGPHLLSGSDDRTAIWWDVDRQRPIHRLRGHLEALPHVFLDREETVAVTGTHSGTIQSWDLATGRRLHTFAPRLPRLEPFLHRELGQVLAHGAMGHLRAFDLETGRDVETPWALATAGAALYSSDARWALDTRDRDSRLWEVDLRRRAGFTQSVTSFARDGSSAAAVTPAGICTVWDLGERRPIGEVELGRWAHLVVPGPGGRFLLTGRENRTSARRGRLTVWNVETGARHLTIEEPRRHLSFTAAAFTPDGRSALTGSEDGRIVRWPLDPLAVAIAHRLRSLSTGERNRFGLDVEERP